MTSHVWTRIVYKDNAIPILGIAPSHECLRCGTMAQISENRRIFPVDKTRRTFMLMRDFHDDCDLAMVNRVNNS